MSEDKLEICSTQTKSPLKKLEDSGGDFFDDSNSEFTNLKLFSQWDIPPNNLIRDGHLLGRLRDEAQPLTTEFTVPEQDKDADIYMDAFSKSDDSSDQSDGDDLNVSKGADSSGLASFMDMFKAKAKTQYDQSLARENSVGSKIVDEIPRPLSSMKGSDPLITPKGSSSSAIEQYKAKVRELELKNHRPDVLNPTKEFAGIELENQSIDIGKQLALPGFGKKKLKVVDVASDGINSLLGKRHSPVVKKFGLTKALQSLKEEETPLMQSDIHHARRIATQKSDEETQKKFQINQVQPSDEAAPSKQIFAKMLKKQEKKQSRKSNKGLDLLAISQLGLN